MVRRVMAREGWGVEGARGTKGEVGQIRPKKHPLHVHVPYLRTSRAWRMLLARSLGRARRSSRLQGKAASPIFRLKEGLVGIVVGLSAA